MRHYRPGSHDFWSPPGGGVEGDEELAATAEREVREETGLLVRATTLAYIDELIDRSGRSVKFWFLADLLGGMLDTTRNPAAGESITEAGWFTPDRLPPGHVFPEPIRHSLWQSLDEGFAHPIKLPLRHSVF